MTNSRKKELEELRLVILQALRFTNDPVRQIRLKNIIDLIEEALIKCK